MHILITILAAIFVFAIVIFIHEFGHFLFAKLFHVRVNEFALGMGPTILKKQGKETLYSLRALPIGGYCAMEGEDDESEDPRAFNRQKVWKRILIVIAGAVFNVILGFLLYMIITGASAAITQPSIASFTDVSPLKEAGFTAQDKIVQLDKTKIHIYQDIEFFMQRADGKPITVTAMRHGKTITKRITPVKATESYSYFPDKIIYIMNQNGKVVDNKTITDAKVLAKYQDKAGKTDHYSRYMLGFTPQSSPLTFSSLMHESFFNTIFICKLVYQSLFELITGQMPLSDVSGPVGIISGISTAASQGFITLLWFLAMITINLGVFNLLPIPALDGGRLVFLIYEGIARKPVPPKKEGLVHTIGFMVLIGFIILVSFSDIMKFFH